MDAAARASSRPIARNDRRTSSHNVRHRQTRPFAPMFRWVSALAEIVTPFVGLKTRRRAFAQSGLRLVPMAHDGHRQRKMEFRACDGHRPPPSGRVRLAQFHTHATAPHAASLLSSERKLHGRGQPPESRCLPAWRASLSSFRAAAGISVSLRRYSTNCLGRRPSRSADRIESSAVFPASDHRNMFCRSDPPSARRSAGIRRRASG